MSSEKDQVKSEDPDVTEAEVSTELEDSDLEEVAGGSEGGETISRQGKDRWGR